MNSKQEKRLVRWLGEKIGYGRIMQLASSLWAKSLDDKGYPTSGAFVPALYSDIKNEVKEDYKKP